MCVRTCYTAEGANLGVLQGPQEHLIQSQGVSPISVHHIIWVHNIAPALAHLVLLSHDQGVRMPRPYQPVPLLLHLCSVQPAHMCWPLTALLVPPTRATLLPDQ